MQLLKKYAGFVLSTTERFLSGLEQESIWRRCDMNTLNNFPRLSGTGPQTHHWAYF